MILKKDYSKGICILFNEALAYEEPRCSIT